MASAPGVLPPPPPPPLGAQPAPSRPIDCRAPPAARAAAARPAAARNKKTNPPPPLPPTTKNHPSTLKGEPYDPDGKFFGNFPYPYMNGLLHLGHAFSLSKLEFAAGYHRLLGKRVLFPQGFHCTGMPIKACADKLDREIREYGCPPVFPSEQEEEEKPAADAATTAADAAAASAAAASAAADKDPSKFVGKKSKAQAKKGTAATQWQILRQSGIPEEEIPAFRDPAHWLRYFPPRAMEDIRALGCGVDWRRAFITTDLNPYYDSFVRWQMQTLRAQGKIVKDKRHAIYSPLDGQPCADHDRATGEGVGPQEYTLIKLKALPEEGASALPGALAAVAAQAPGGAFLLAATLRPETMYGQTNAWVLPEGDYGAFEGLNGEAYVCTRRAALNLSYQELLPEQHRGQPKQLAALKGQDLIGLRVDAPNAPAPVRVLPLLTILTNKGTGVVTSVPSDSPDDYTALKDLQSKPKLREKFGVAEEWGVEGLQPIHIIDIPGFDGPAAPAVCAQLKVASQNDAAKLAEAKGMVYLKVRERGVGFFLRSCGRARSLAPRRAPLFSPSAPLPIPIDGSTDRSTSRTYAPITHRQRAASLPRDPPSSSHDDNTHGGAFRPYFRGPEPIQWRGGKTSRPGMTTVWGPPPTARSGLFFYRCLPLKKGPNPPS
jgi:leucyl-tRNA synthetase